MEISNSELKLSNQHKAREMHSRFEAILDRIPMTEQADGEEAAVNISQLGKLMGQLAAQQLAAAKPPATKQQSSEPTPEANSEEALPPKFRSLKILIELLSGEKLDMALINRLKEIEQQQFERGLVSDSPLPVTETRPDDDPPMTEIVYVNERSSWSQQNHFSAAGKLDLANGEQLSFEFESEFSQSFYYESSTLLARDELKDPLVFSFDGGPVKVTSDTHDFDLNGDGEQDSVAILGRDNAYLALDRNQDGQINDGLELFGARTNNGFAELAEFDEDGNGFIDSGDSIYEQLQLWFKSTDTEKLLSLSDADVAAISLDHINTPYRLMDEQQQQQGVIRQSGVFIDNQGLGGLVQQIDLKI